MFMYTHFQSDAGQIYNGGLNTIDRWQAINIRLSYADLFKRKRALRKLISITRDKEKQNASTADYEYPNSSFLVIKNSLIYG